jgi:hypothetical protein
MGGANHWRTVGVDPATGRSPSVAGFQDFFWGPEKAEIGVATGSKQVLEDRNRGKKLRICSGQEAVTETSAHAAPFSFWRLTPRRRHGHWTTPEWYEKAINSNLDRRPAFRKIRRSRFLMTCSLVEVRSAIRALLKPAQTKVKICRSVSLNPRRNILPAFVMR